MNGIITSRILCAWITTTLKFNYFFLEMPRIDKTKLGFPLQKYN